MAKDERYDVIIVGAGHNGTTTAAYLAKCGLSVLVLEERPEGGGAQETCEPIAGVRIQPHAIVVGERFYRGLVIHDPTLLNVET